MFIQLFISNDWELSIYYMWMSLFIPGYTSTQFNQGSSDMKPEKRDARSGAQIPMITELGEYHIIDSLNIFYPVAMINLLIHGLMMW